VNQLDDIEIKHPRHLDELCGSEELIYALAKGKFEVIKRTIGLVEVRVLSQIVILRRITMSPTKDIKSSIVNEAKQILAYV